MLESLKNTTANMFNKQTLKVMINERLLETAEQIFLLFEQAVAEYQGETERLKHVGEADQPVAVPSPQWTKAVVQQEVLHEGNGGCFPCEVKTEPSLTQEDEPQMLITNVKSLCNGDELQLRGQEQPTNSEGAAGTENYPETSPEPEQEDSGTANDQDASRSDASKETFSCPACEKRFPQIRFLKLHIGKVHPGEKQVYDEVWKPVSCPVCNKDVIHQCRLKTHMRIHTGEKPFACTECGKGFTILCNLKSHMRTHLGNNKPFRCGKCGGRYADKTSLKQHKCAAVVLSPKVSSKGAQETEAQAGSDKDNTGSRHFKAERAEIMITPKEEPQIVNIESLNRGEEQASGEAETENCPETNPEPEEEDSDRANDEPASRSDAPKKTFSCPACERRFPRIRGLKMHMRKVHPGKKKLYSAVCKDREQLAQPDADVFCRPFSCTVCFRRFKLQSSLDAHMKAHTERNPRTCAECGASFPYHSSFVSHMRRVHSTDKPFMCSICYRDCKSLGNFNAHVRIHTGERPYLCAECGRGFVLRANLKTHLRTHLRGKPFKCGQCGEKYKSKTALKRHKCAAVGAQQTETARQEEPQTLNMSEERLNCGKDLRPRGKQQKTNSSESSPDSEDDDSDTSFDAPKKSFCCPACKRCFPQIRGLKMHMRMVHPGEKQLYTEVCNAEPDGLQRSPSRPDMDSDTE